MTKFSVKKPMTVLVAVIIVLVLGFVSFSKMTPNLMPNMDMPYVIVSTAYPGASPEKVEFSVTKPLEKSLATLENIKNVTSTSNENYSMVMLEFNDSVNMDTITVDILQKINLIEGNWDEMIGTPSIMKINPSMMPVQVAAIDAEGMSTAQLSKFVKDDILDNLEAIDGVVNVTTSGLITQTVNVKIDEDKIKAVNKSVYEALNGQFDEKESELSAAKSKIESGQKELESGKSQINDAKKELVDKTASAQSELDKKSLDLLEGKIEIKSTIQSFNEKTVTLSTQILALRELETNVTQLEQSKTSLENTIKLLEQIKSSYAAAKAYCDSVDAQVEAIKLDNSLSAAEKQEKITALTTSREYLTAKATLSTIEAQLKAQGLKIDGVDSAILQSKEALEKVNDGLSAIDNSLASQGISREKLSAAITEAQAGVTQLEATVSNLEDTLKGLESGQTGLSQAKEQLEKGKSNGILSFSETTATMLTGNVSLSSASSEIESGYTAFKTAKETALKNADLTKTLTLSMISNILSAENFSMPAGYASKDGTDYLVSVGDEFKSVDEIGDLIIVDLGLDDIDPICLSDIADVEMADNSDDVYAKINSNNGVMFVFQKQSTYATATVSNNITDEFKALEKQYDNIHFTSLMDQGEYIYLIIDSLFESLLFGAIFAVLILFLFLKDLRPTFITLCSIPISILFAIVLMYFSGVTLNMISLSGLAVAVGMLVDNSVVVIENIYRLKNSGVSTIKAAVSGATQVFGAIAASTLTTICVFLPIVFVEGLTRQMFSDMALTIGYSLIASLIVAVTLVPAMSSRMLNNVKPKQYKLLDKVLRFYDKSLRFTLRHKLPALALAVLLLVSSCVLAFQKGFIFMPDMETGQLSVTLEMPYGTKLDQTKKTADKVMAVIDDIESVETVGGLLSTGMMSSMNSSTDTRNVSFYVMLKEGADVSGKQVANEINNKCKNFDGEVIADSDSGLSSSLSSLTGSGVSINVYGDDLETLQKSAKAVADKLKAVEGTKNVSDGMEETSPVIKFVVNKDKAMKNGLTVAQVYNEISNALKTSVSSTTVTIDSKNYEVNVTNGEDRNALDDIENLKISFTDKQGNEKKVKISDIADINETTSLNAISRENQKRYITVTAEVKDGYNITLVNENAEKSLKSYKTPTGVSYEFNGESESIMDSMSDLLLMMALGVLFVYLIMVAQFQSLKSPFIVMFTIPLALTGGLFALLICGKEVSVISMIGFVMLCGIIVNNGIVLVDYIIQLRKTGMEKRDAIVEACKTRLRPVLMTTITTILGLIVMALGASSGTDIMQPIAIVCIGGLTYATLLTLFVVPIIYDAFNRKKIKTISDEDLEPIDE